MDDTTKEDLPGQTATISKADYSIAGDSIAASSQSPSTLPLPPLQPLRNTIVHVSPAEHNCDEETVETHAFAQSSTTSENKVTHVASNGSCEAVATKEHLTVWIDDQSEVPQRFQLTRSPTISFGDSGEAPLLEYPCPLDPSCDEAEPDDELLSEDKSEARSSRAGQPSPQISPSLGSNDGHDIDATPSNFLLPEEAESRRDIEEDNSILVVSMKSRLRNSVCVWLFVLTLQKGYVAQFRPTL